MNYQCISKCFNGGIHTHPITLKDYESKEPFCFIYPVLYYGETFYIKKCSSANNIDLDPSVPFLELNYDNYLSYLYKIDSLNDALQFDRADLPVENYERLIHIAWKIYGILLKKQTLANVSPISDCVVEYYINEMKLKSSDAKNVRQLLEKYIKKYEKKWNNIKSHTRKIKKIFTKYYNI